MDDASSRRPKTPRAAGADVASADKRAAHRAQLAKPTEPPPARGAGRRRGAAARTHKTRTRTGACSMPLGRIMIEQTLDAWTAEVEAGGIAARCRVLRAPDLDAIVERARDAYRELAGLSGATSEKPAATPPAAAPAAKSSTKAGAKPAGR